MLPKRPPRQDEIAVTAVLQLDVELKHVGSDVKGLDELTRLIVVPRSGDVAVDLLEADQVGVLILDDLNHPLQPVTSITPADAFMDIVAE